MIRRPPRSPLFPSTPLFRSHDHHLHHQTPPRGSPSQDHSAHAHMVDDFRRRFWVSLGLTVPVLATSEMLQHILGLRSVLAFPGDQYEDVRSEEHTSELQSQSNL